MSETLLNLLLEATGWLTAARLAELGKWRSPAHVGIELGKLEKQERVVRRPSPTTKKGNGMPATEWRHVDKNFDVSSAPVAPVQPAVTVTTPAVVDAPDSAQAPARPKKAPPTVTVSLSGAAGGGDGSKLREAVKTTTGLPKLIDDMTVKHKLLAASIEAKNESIAILTSQLDQVCELLSDIVESNIIDPADMDAVELAKRAVVTIVKLRCAASPPRIDVNEAATGYLLRTPKRRARIITNPQRARDLAISAAKSAGTVEVLALIPIGRAVREATWRDS